jgi:hypothetical protein
VCGIRLSFPGSSVRCDATPKDDGREGESAFLRERSVRAKDSSFVLDCFVTLFLAMTLAERECLRAAMTLAEGKKEKGE